MADGRITRSARSVRYMRGLSKSIGIAKQSVVIISRLCHTRVGRPDSCTRGTSAREVPTGRAAEAGGARRGEARRAPVPPRRAGPVSERRGCVCAWNRLLCRNSKTQHQIRSPQPHPHADRRGLDAGDAPHAPPRSRAGSGRVPRPSSTVGPRGRAPCGGTHAGPLALQNALTMH